MKFSLCTWTFGELPIVDIIQFAADVGYDELEVGAAVEQHDWKEIKQTAIDKGISLRGINADASFLRPNTDLANKDESLRNDAIEYFKKQLDVGEFLESEYMVLAPTAPGISISDSSVKERWLRGVSSIKQLAPYAKSRGITIVIEPLNRYESCLVNNAEHAAHFLSEVNEPNVKTMLDTFHMNIEEVSFIDPFKKLEGKLETVHFADSNRRGLGHGHIPFDSVVQGINNVGYDKTITLECLAPGGHPFEPTQRNNIDLHLKYAKESLRFLKKKFN